MKIIPDNSFSNAECVDFDAAKAAKDVPITDPFDPRCARASDIPITSFGPLFAAPTDEVDVMAAVGAERSNPNLHRDCSVGDAPLCPNQADITNHLYALFPPEFVQPYPDAWIEIAY